MDGSDLAYPLNVINTELHIPLKHLFSTFPDTQVQGACIAFLDCQWISHILNTMEYCSPPVIDMNENEISCFLMPSIFAKVPDGWNCFIISVLNKLPQNSSHQHHNSEATDSIFRQLIQLKSNLKLRDRQILASRYSTSSSNDSPQVSNFDKNLLEKQFGSVLIEVHSEVPAFDPTPDSTHSHLVPTLSPHILYTYCILESDKHYFTLQPYTKVTLLDAIKYSPALLTSNRLQMLFLLYQLKFCVDSLSESLTNPDSFNLSSLYIDKNLWLSHSCTTPAPSVAKQTPDENNSDIVLTKFPLLQESTRLWQECKLSNFDYVMLINKFAGRKEGDPNNHPFLPWVSDFRTPDKSWRDLTKSKYRLSKGDAQLDFTYSSPACCYKDGLESFLEPHHVTDTFSEITYFIYLARRTPRSILCKYVRPRWEPSEYPTSIERIQEWTPDECIPEFFTQPSTFRSIHPDLPDLRIPEWCESPESFVAWHMDALESDHVSLMLHHWIDLYFGYKLSGEAALKAKNIPHFLLKKHECPYNYGINQLFRDPHPRKQLSNYLHTYYAGADMSFSSKVDVVYSSESQEADNRSSLISMELVNIEVNSEGGDNNISNLPDADANEEGKENLYDSCQVEHFDVVHVTRSDIAEPLIRKPEETKRAFDFENTKFSKHLGNIFRGRSEVLDETQILKYRNYIPLPPNLDFGRLLDEFDVENSFFYSQPICSRQSEKRTNDYLLYQATTNSLQKQILLITLSLELLSINFLKSYPFSAPLNQRIILLDRILRDTQLQTRLDSKPLLAMLKKCKDTNYFHKNFIADFPIMFPSYFELIHSFVSKMNAHKSSLLALSHLGARPSYRASDYSTLISFLQSETTVLLAVVPQEGLHLVGNQLKWIFTDNILSPLAFLEIFPVVASYMPSLYLQQNYLGAIQKVYCDLKDHPVYPSLFQRSFISSLIDHFGPVKYFATLLKYLVKALTPSNFFSQSVVQLVSDNLAIFQKQQGTASTQSLRRPSLSIEESNSEKTDLLNNIASSLIASDTFVWLFYYFGITISTKFLLKEMIALLPDYACKFVLQVNSFEQFYDMFLHDTCFYTLHTTLKNANKEYTTFICFNYITSWINQVQKRALNVRTEGFLSSILVISHVWLLTVPKHYIQLSLSRFIKDIVDVIFQLISSKSTFFTRGSEFRHHLLIALLHLLREVVASEIELQNLSLIKSSLSNIFESFISLNNLQELQGKREDLNKINTQLEAVFTKTLLSQFVHPIRDFLKEYDIPIPSLISHISGGDVKWSKPVFSYRAEFKELVSLFYPFKSGLTTQDIHYGKPTWFLPYHNAISTFSLAENEKCFDTKFSAPLAPTTQSFNYSMKSNWIEYFKQSYDQTEDPKIFTHLQTLSGSEAPVSKLCYSPCENIIFGSCRENVTVWKLYDSLMPSEIRSAIVYKNHTKPVKSLCYVNDSNNVVSNDGCIHVWNIDSLHNSYKHQHHNKLHQVHCTSSQTQRIIYSATSEGTLTVLDTRVPKLSFDWVIPNAPSTFQHINTTPDDATIYLSSSNGNVFMIDTRMGHILGNWFVAETDITSMLIHKNQLLYACSDSPLKIFSLQGQLQQTISCRYQVEYMEELTDSVVICGSFSESTLTLYLKQDNWMPVDKWTLPCKYNSSILSMVYTPLQQYLFTSLDSGLVMVYGTHFTHKVPNFK